MQMKQTVLLAMIEAFLDQFLVSCKAKYWKKNDIEKYFR